VMSSNVPYERLATSVNNKVNDKVNDKVNNKVNETDTLRPAENHVECDQSRLLDYPVGLCYYSFRGLHL